MRLHWIGSLEHADRLLAIRSDLGGSSLDTLRNLDRQPIAPSSDKYSTSTVQALLISAIFNLRMKVVTGTSDAQQEAMLLAGDVDAIVSNPSELAPKFESGGLIPILKLSRSTVSEALKDVPALADVVPAGVPEELVFFLESVDIIGRPIAAGPTTDPQVVAALRTAFDQAASNPAYVDAMAKLRISINPTTGTETTERLEQILGPASTRLKEVLESHLACGEKMSDDGTSDCE
jgi:tripartite-type tricarboxylate transporter receptor subunit TctC